MNTKKQKKRSWRRNIWGNVIGYEGGRRSVDFPNDPRDEEIAELWSQGMTYEEASDKAYGF